MHTAEGLSNVMHIQQVAMYTLTPAIANTNQSTNPNHNLPCHHYDITETYQRHRQSFSFLVWGKVWYGIVGFNVPLDTIIGHFGDDFTGQ